MNFTTLFIKRPVMTTLVMIGILVFGIVAYRQLPVSDLPNVDFPTVTVSATLPGTSPQTMAATVATPLEKQFSTIAGIDNMTSTSSLGTTQIVIQFALDRNIDAAAQDVQAAIAQTARQLPQGIIPPSYQKTNPADAPILTLALTSSEVPLSTLDEIGETSIAQRLSMVAGVAQVLVYGAQKYAVRLQLDPGQLASRNIALEDVAQAVTQQNVNMPTGVLYGPRTALTVQATGQLENANQFGDVIVAFRNGAPVHLDEIGRITDDVQNNKTASWYNGSRSIVLAIQRQPGTNTVDVASRVKASLDKIGAEIPPSVQMSVLFDRSQTIKASVDDVTFTLELTLFLVVAVIFLFLRNWSATIIPSLALPMSIIGTFSVMYLLHYSLDNLSLMALTLAVGFVVDDAIVMLENIVRHLEMGKTKMQAAIDGASEVGFTILSMTFSLAAVFIPFLFMGGIIGKLFHEFAVTIGVAILVSGFVSLTLTPMLSSRFLKSDHGKQHGRLYNATERFYDAWLGVYERTLTWVMERRPLTLVFSFIILVATGYLFWSTPKGLFPTDDTGQLLATTEAQEGVSFDALVRHQAEVADVIRKDPDVRSVTSSVGTTAAANQGQITIDLKPIEERKRSAQDIARDLMHATSSVSDITTYIQNPPAISIGGLASKSLYQYTLQSGDISALNTSAREMERRLRQIPGLIDVTSDLLIENPQITVDIDREQAGQLGVSASEIENTLYDAFGQRQVSTIYTATNEYWVVMELLPEYQQDVDALGKLWVRSSRGPLVPLSTVAKFNYGVGPVTVNHSGQLPAVTVSFNLAPGVSIGTAVKQVEAAAKDVLPNTVGASFSGMAQAFVSTQEGLLVLLLLAVFVIYVILGVLYESFIHPITILTGLPFAAFGALVTLILFGLDLDIYGFVGIIMLIGIVEKNAIMMIDFAIEAQRDGNRTPSEAILEAASVRFRPIMMTTMAALMGAIPIAVGWGAGASTRRPLGLAVVGGLAFSQLVTLYVTPVFYTYLDEWQQGLSAVARSRNTAPASPRRSPPSVADIDRSRRRRDGARLAPVVARVIHGPRGPFGSPLAYVDGRPVRRAGLFLTAAYARVKRMVANRLSTDTYVGLHLTVSFLIAAGAVWVSSALLEAILDNATIVRWDLAAAKWFHARATPTGTELSLRISSLGSPTSMGVIAVLVGLELLRRRRKTMLVAWIAAFVGGGTLELILKMLVHRKRPLFNTSSAAEQALSFPSGHSMMCLLGVGMLVYVLIVLMPAQLAGARRSVLIALAALFVLLVGISRVYLGAHFPSDVVGGYAAGAGWMAICVGVRGIVKHRRHRRTQAGAAKPQTSRHAHGARSRG